MTSFLTHLLTHMGLALLLLSIIATCWVVYQLPRPLTGAVVADVALSYLLLFCVGGYGIYGFVLHAFFPSAGAAMFGWPVGSYQWLLAMMYFALGLLGTMGYGYGFAYQFATGIMAVCVFWGMALSQAYELILSHHMTWVSGALWFLSEALTPLCLLGLLLYSHGRHSHQTRGG